MRLVELAKGLLAKPAPPVGAPIASPPSAAAADPFLAYITPTLGVEGGYSNHPSDKGGETRWGITVARARAAGYTGPMQDMPRETAVEIYRLFYWTQPGFDRIHAIDGPLGLLLLDLGINFGQARVGAFLQRALNVLNARGKAWPDITVDGACGAMTRAALAAFVQQRGAEGRRVLHSMVRAMASVRYVEIAEADPTQEDFEYGWQLHRGIGAAA
jgi:lysozyme family protein